MLAGASLSCAARRWPLCSCLSDPAIPPSVMIPPLVMTDGPAERARALGPDVVRGLRSHPPQYHYSLPVSRERLRGPHRADSTFRLGFGRAPPQFVAAKARRGLSVGVGGVGILRRKRRGPARRPWVRCEREACSLEAKLASPSARPSEHRPTRTCGPCLSAAPVKRGGLSDPRRLGRPPTQCPKDPERGSRPRSSPREAPQLPTEEIGA